MENENTCYYYDAGTNHCRCYGSESLNALLTENARLKEDMRDLEAYDQILRDNLRRDNELRLKAQAECNRAQELMELLLDGVADIQSENARLKRLVQCFLSEHADYIAEGNYFIGDLDLANTMRHNQAYFRREARKLGVEEEE